MKSYYYVLGSNVSDRVNHDIPCMLLLMFAFAQKTKNSASLSIKYLYLSICPDISLLIQHPNAVNSRGHGLTHLKNHTKYAIL